MKSQSQRNESVFYYGACDRPLLCWAWNDIQMNLMPPKITQHNQPNNFNAYNLVLLLKSVQNTYITYERTHATTMIRDSQSDQLPFKYSLPSICSTSLWPWGQLLWDGPQFWFKISKHCDDRIDIEVVNRLINEYIAETESVNYLMSMSLHYSRR